MSVSSIDVDQHSFQRDVLEESRDRPVLVDFWAPWCGPCRALKPVLEKLATEYNGRFRLAKVNSDENPDLSSRYAVRSIPSVKVFVDGEIADEFMGALPESSVREFIDRLLPTPGELLRRQAMEAITAGRPEEGQRMLHEALSLDPRNDIARIDLCEVLLTADQPNEARVILNAVSLLAARDPALARRLAALRLSLSASSGPDETILQARLESDASDHNARLMLARRFISGGRYEEGLDHLIELVRRDRRFGDDAGRREMLQTFDLLESGNPLVPRYRRLLAATLN
jgi:putative thioredoxin